MKNTISEMKNTILKINIITLDEAEDQISDFEDKVGENTQSEQQKEKKNLENEDILRDHWDNTKHNSICIIKVPEEEERANIENLFEKIMTGNFPNLVKKKDTQLQEVQRVPSKMNLKKPTPRHINIKMQKVKDRENRKSSKRKIVIYNTAPMRLSADFSTETFQARRDWHKNIQRDEKQGPTVKTTLPSEVII